MTPHHLIRRLFSLATPLMLTACAGMTQPALPQGAEKDAFCAYDAVLAERVAQATSKRPSKAVLGWVEWGKIKNTDHVVKAKLDSGAETTSINAEIVREFQKEGKDYLLYHVRLGDEEKTVTFESPITRWVKIRTKTGGHIRRPVVEMELCVGGRAMKGEVNLAQRDHFNYPILVGRNMLAKSKVLVDSSDSFLAEHGC